MTGCFPSGTVEGESGATNNTELPIPSDDNPHFRVAMPCTETWSRQGEIIVISAMAFPAKQPVFLQNLDITERN
jgi:hypothetical protein